MFKKTLLTMALSTLALSASAHQLWLERDATGPVRVYVGDADSAHDKGEEVAKLAATTQVFTSDRKQTARLTAREEFLEADVAAAGDVRLFNDQVWKPWKAKDGSFQAALFNARAGRSETKAVLEHELVPLAAGGNSFTLLFKGQPLANKVVTVITPDKWSKGFKTDAAGRIDVPVSGKGRYVLVSTHEAPAVGEVVIAGQKVAKLGYTTTLTFVAP